jgi:hypothetical protein
VIQLFLPMGCTNLTKCHSTRLFLIIGKGLNPITSTHLISDIKMF